MKIKTVLIIIFVIAVVALSTKTFATIKTTRHNLSNWNPILGAVKAAGTTLRDTEVCIFCHTPHNTDSAQAPLWNHEDTSATFQMASSANVKPGRTSLAGSQPTGISKKCLSCHDGTVAIGAIRPNPRGNIAMQGGGADSGNRLDSSNAGYIGTDLAKGHVISFDYYSATNGNGNFVQYGSIPAADRISMFDRNRQMQCHSCHDPHDDWCDDTNNTVGHDPLWRKPCVSGKNDSVCKVCHNTFTVHTFPN